MAGVQVHPPEPVENVLVGHRTTVGMREWTTFRYISFLASSLFAADPLPPILEPSVGSNSGPSPNPSSFLIFGVEGLGFLLFVLGRRATGLLPFRVLFPRLSRKSALSRHAGVGAISKRESLGASPAPTASPPPFWGRRHAPPSFLSRIRLRLFLVEGDLLDREVVGELLSHISGECFSGVRVLMAVIVGLAVP